MSGRSTARKLVVLVLIPFGMLLVGALGATAFLLKAGKDINRNDDWYDTPNGIDEAFYVSLNGHEQFVRIRSRNSRNPVLLILHGGPGVAMSDMLYRVNRPLADYFTLVDWDQRGAGRSHIDEALMPSMTYQRMVDDTIALIEHLQSHLGVRHVTLLGQSWGSMLGLGVIKARPDLIAAYVGVGQSLAFNSAFDETARLIRNAAEEVGDTEVVATLRALPGAWPPAASHDEYFKRIETIQQYLVKYGKGLHAGKETDFNKSVLVLDTVLSPNIGIMELMDNLERSSLPTTALIEDLEHRDLREEFGTDYEVPVFIFQGDHDWQTPTTLVKPWFDSLNTPHKAYVAFKHSGHMPNIEEQGRYIHELISRVRPFSQEY
ncbi:MAG: alpha/beta hydrolase [Halioglobus sp.]|nr:alpha/beta hydrolase [Halioglobus sp.]